METKQKHLRLQVVYPVRNPNAYSLLTSWLYLATRTVNDVPQSEKGNGGDAGGVTASGLSAVPGLEVAPGEAEAPNGTP